MNKKKVLVVASIGLLALAPTHPGGGEETGKTHDEIAAAIGEMRVNGQHPIQGEYKKTRKTLKKLEEATIGIPVDLVNNPYVEEIFALEATIESLKEDQKQAEKNLKKARRGEISTPAGKIETRIYDLGQEIAQKQEEIAKIKEEEAEANKDIAVSIKEDGNFQVGEKAAQIVAGIEDANKALEVKSKAVTLYDAALREKVMKDAHLEEQALLLKENATTTGTPPESGTATPVIKELQREDEDFQRELKVAMQKLKVLVEDTKSLGKKTTEDQTPSSEAEALAQKEIDRLSDVIKGEPKSTVEEVVKNPKANEFFKGKGLPSQLKQKAQEIKEKGIAKRKRKELYSDLRRKQKAYGEKIRKNKTPKTEYKEINPKIKRKEDIRYEFAEIYEPKNVLDKRLGSRRKVDPSEKEIIEMSLRAGRETTGSKEGDLEQARKYFKALPKSFNLALAKAIAQRSEKNKTRSLLDIVKDLTKGDNHTLTSEADALQIFNTIARDMILSLPIHPTEGTEESEYKAKVKGFYNQLQELREKTRTERDTLTDPVELDLCNSRRNVVKNKIYEIEDREGYRSSRNWAETVQGYFS